MTADEFAVQEYFVGAVVEASIVLESFKQPTASDVKKVFAKPPTKLLGTRDSTAPLQVIDDPTAPPGVLRKLVTTSSGPDTRPQDALSSTDGFTFDLGRVIPKNLTVGKASARQASTASLTLKYLDMPLDPRTIRSIAVRVIVGTTTQESFEAGAVGQALNLVPSSYVDDEGHQRSNVRFEGWADTIELEWDEDGEPIVRLECRDNVALLDSQLAPPKLALDANKPIHESIAVYLSNFPQFAGTSVEYRPSGATPPTLKDALARTAYRPNLGPSQSGGGSRTSVHDYLTDCTGALGHILRLEGTTIIVQEVRSLVGDEFAGRQDDPFQGRDLQSGRAPYRKFVYGRNIQTMKCKRKFARGSPTNVEVRAYDCRTKSVIAARFPDSGNADANGKPNVPALSPKPGGSTEQKWEVHYVSGVSDPKTLAKIAQGFYEMSGRGEIEVEIKTRNLGSLGGSNLDPDVLDLEAGDTIEVLTNRSDDEMASVTQMETLLLSQARAQDFMKALGYSDEFSAAYATSFGHTAFPTIFKVRHLGIAWDVDEGIALTIQAVNYTEVLFDQELPPGQEVAGGKGSTKTTGGP